VGQLDKPEQTWRSDGTPTRSGNKPDIQPGPADNFVTAGPAWSNVSNAPFRSHKDTNHEGGIAAPCIAWWPGTVPQTGKITHELAHIADIMATCLDVASISYPAQFDGRSVLPLAGKSLLPVLQGGRREGHASLCWATSGCGAVRAGKWKLVAAKNGPWELYDMEIDRTELNDLAAAQPERVKAMAGVFNQWRKSSQGE